MRKRVKSSSMTAFEVLKAAGRAYGEDRVNRMAAAVAYRAIFALAPLLLVAVFVFGLVLGSNATAQSEILDAVDRFAGPDVQDAVVDVIGSVRETGVAAGILGFALLLWTASSLFLEVQNALNDIFAVPYEHTTGVVAFVKKRGLGFLFSLGLGVVLVAVWLLNLVWNLLGDLFPEGFEPAHRLIGVLTPLVSLVVLPFVIAAAFQVLSQVKVRRRAVWRGAFFTAATSLAAAYGTGLYFSLTARSAAGFAGSVFVVLLLAYVLSSVFLFGAEVTKVYSDYLDDGGVAAGNVTGRHTPGAVVAEPPPSVPLEAVAAFLSGLVIGWWRRR